MAIVIRANKVPANVVKLNLRLMQTKKANDAPFAKNVQNQINRL